MKISSIQYNPTPKKGPLEVPENNFSGSFTGKSGAATTLFKAKWFNSFLEFINHSQISSYALISLLFAGIMRPATLMATSTKKNREDNIYASGHGVASGIIGFATSYIITTPLNNAIDKIKAQPDKYSFTILSEKNAEIKRLKQNIKTSAGETKKDYQKQIKNLSKHKDTIETIVKNTPEWIIAVPRAMITIALIPLILKYVFGVEKKKAPSAIVQNNLTADKKIFEDFKGGLKS